MSELSSINCRVCGGSLGLFSRDETQGVQKVLAEILPGLECVEISREQARALVRCYCLVPGAWNVGR